MTLTESIEKCYGNYAKFEGRASRSEFWWTYLAFSIFGYIVQINTGIQSLLRPAMADQLSLIQTVILIVAGIPLIAAATRRLHDTGKSGWFQLLALTIVGAIPLFIWLGTDSDSKENIYGLKPKD